VDSAYGDGGFSLSSFLEGYPISGALLQKIGTGGMDNELLHGSRIHGVPRGLTDGPPEAYP
jgi:hypothetical protein